MLLWAEHSDLRVQEDEPELDYVAEAEQAAAADSMRSTLPLSFGTYPLDSCRYCKPPSLLLILKVNRSKSPEEATSLSLCKCMELERWRASVQVCCVQDLASFWRNI